KEGAAVAITDILESALADARPELESLVSGARALAIHADNKDHDAAQRVVAEVVGAFGRLDILVNNAQEFRTGIRVEDITWDDMITSYESGVFAYWRFMVAAFPHLKESKGTVINFGSGAGSMGVPLNGAYGSNKEAVRGLSRTAAREWGAFGITVNI